MKRLILLGVFCLAMGVRTVVAGKPSSGGDSELFLMREQLLENLGRLRQLNLELRSSQFLLGENRVFLRALSLHRRCLGKYRSDVLEWRRKVSLSLVELQKRARAFTDCLEKRGDPSFLYAISAGLSLVSLFVPPFSPNGSTLSMVGLYFSSLSLLAGEGCSGKKSCCKGQKASGAKSSIGKPSKEGSRGKVRGKSCCRLGWDFKSARERLRELYRNYPRPPSHRAAFHIFEVCSLKGLDSSEKFFCKIYLNSFRDK